ncbi:MAG TPA: hypothetical protein VN285_12130 [Candidatus Deferrimicrobium sp.]|nr:hypothetical protein [Candidatus Deferrimicrobium sp.]
MTFSIGVPFIAAMRNVILLLIGVASLYLVSSVVLQAVYGPSFGFLSGEDCWIPDGNGGWTKHGSPSGPPPGQPSVHVPAGMRYIPIFLPAVLLILFLFTPLKRFVDRPEREEAVTDVDS